MTTIPTDQETLQGKHNVVDVFSVTKLGKKIKRTSTIHCRGYSG